LAGLSLASLDAGDQVHDRQQQHGSGIPRLHTDARTLLKIGFTLAALIGAAFF
jgi:hypothetical protein